MKHILVVTLIFYLVQVSSQPNCEAFKYFGDTTKYRACLAAEMRFGHYQFSKEYQEAFDQALLIDSSFAFAYREKSTAYLKSGDFITWKDLMDKAVKYDANGQLGYRGWCRYQFFRDYKGAIEDIELLDSLIDYDIGYSVNGDYHLHIARALCYKALGEPQMAIQIIEKQISDNPNFVGIYDYLHLGVLNLEVGNYQEAVKYLKKQETENDMAENRYYLALALKALGKRSAYEEQLKFAKVKYENRQRSLDPYTMHADKIYLSDIIEEMQNTNSK